MRHYSPQQRQASWDTQASPPPGGDWGREWALPQSLGWGVPEAHGSYSRAREAQGLLGAHVQPLSLCPLPPGHMLLSRGPWGLQLPSEMEDSVLRCLQGQSPPLYVSPLKS